MMMPLGFPQNSFRYVLWAKHSTNRHFSVSNKLQPRPADLTKLTPQKSRKPLQIDYFSRKKRSSKSKSKPNFNDIQHQVERRLKLNSEIKKLEITEKTVVKKRFRGKEIISGIPALWIGGHGLLFKRPHKASIRLMKYACIVWGISIGCLLAKSVYTGTIAAPMDTFLDLSWNDQLFLVRLGANVIAIVPFMEEFAFRFAMLLALARTGVITSTLVSSLLYGSVHAFDMSQEGGRVRTFFRSTMFGIMQCLLMHAHLTLLLPVTIHGLVNGWQYVKGVDVLIEGLHAVQQQVDSGNAIEISD
eukprot:587713_1